VPTVRLTAVTVAATGDGSPDETWDRYTTPVRWSSWSPQIRDVDTTDPGRRVDVGTTGTVRGPAGAHISFVVTEVDAERRRWTWQVRAGLVTLTLEHGVEPHGSGVRAWARVIGPLPVVLAYAPLSRLALGRLVAVPGDDEWADRTADA
jgi:hypothetical protein